MVISRDSTDPAVIDLQWMGLPGCVAAWRVGDVLIDCGPATTLLRLIERCGEWRPKALLLTHIHFDHAGAAGDLVARWPDLDVYVHRRGARHLAAPAQLESSARRVFGDEFDLRFGALRPIPEERLRPLDGNETIGPFRVKATPGHASHHVAFLHDSGLAFPGDLCGIRLAAHGPVLLPTPPPDIDLDLWSASLELVADWQPTALALPHFGRFADPEAHFDATRRHLALVRDLVARRVDLDRYTHAINGALGLEDEPQLREQYDQLGPLEQNLLGLQRWWAGRDQSYSGAGLGGHLSQLVWKRDRPS